MTIASGAGSAHGPWLQTAVLCRQVAGDDAGRVAALDIIDGVALAAAEPVTLGLVIAVVRGGHAGSFLVRVIARDPEGTPLAELRAEGDPPDLPYAHSRIVLPIELVAGRPGVFWFDVELAGTLVTRVPLRVDWRAA